MDVMFRGGMLSFVSQTSKKKNPKWRTEKAYERERMKNVNQIDEYIG